MWSDHKGQRGFNDECLEHSSENNCLEVEKPVFQTQRRQKERMSSTILSLGGTERVGSAIVRMRTPRNLRQGILRNGGALAAFRASTFDGKSLKPSLKQAGDLIGRTGMRLRIWRNLHGKKGSLLAVPCISFSPDL